MSNNKQQTAVEFFYKEVWVSFHNKLTWSECERLNKIEEDAKLIEKQQAEHYATFITNCVTNNLPTITFNDWINLYNNEQR